MSTSDRRGTDRLEVVRDDITALECSTVVNAANSTLLGGGGVDGAIHRAAGPRLLEHCRKLPQVSPGVRCPAGGAVLTPAFDLPCDFVIHTVGPVWQGGDHDEERVLAACYRKSLEMARDSGIISIAFPAISCGAYGFPLERACTTAVREVWEFILCSDLPGRVMFAALTGEVHSCLKEALRKITVHG